MKFGWFAEEQAQSLSLSLWDLGKSGDNIGIQLFQKENQKKL